MTEIDWSEFGGNRAVCYCHCGGAFFSHTKMITDENGELVHMFERKCPECDRTDNVYRVSFEDGELILSWLGKKPLTSDDIEILDAGSPD